MRHKIFSLLVLTCLLLFPFKWASCQQEEQQVRVPKNLRMRLELLSPISTATNRKGDTFSCKVLEPAEFAGAIVSGRIKNLKRSGRANKRSEIDLEFNMITLADGRTGSFNAQVSEVYEVAGVAHEGEADPEGMLKAKSRVSIAVKRAIIGALIGAAIGGAIAGSQGAAAGAAIGASAAITTTLSVNGPDLEFKQGTQIVVLTNEQPRRRRAPAPQSAAVPSETKPKAAVADTPAPPQIVQLEDPARQSEPIAPAQAANSAQVVAHPSPNLTPPPPSSRLRIYTSGNLFRLTVPVNWRESSTTNPVTFAPEGGYILYHGDLVLIYGTRVGTMHPQSNKLQQASEQCVSTLLQSNPYLQRRGDYRKAEMTGRESLALDLSGISPVDGFTETVTVYTTMLRNGELLYLITVVPQEQYSVYGPVFKTIVRSLQIND